MSPEVIAGCADGIVLHKICQNQTIGGAVHADTWICETKHEKILAFYSVGVTYSATTSFTGYSYASFVCTILPMISYLYQNCIRDYAPTLFISSPWMRDLLPDGCRGCTRNRHLNSNQSLLTAQSAWYWSRASGERRKRRYRNAMPTVIALIKENKKKNFAVTETHIHRKTEATACSQRNLNFFVFRTNGSSRRECRQHELSLYIWCRVCVCRLHKCRQTVKHFRTRNLIWMRRLTFFVCVCARLDSMRNSPFHLIAFYLVLRETNPNRRVA